MLHKRRSTYVIVAHVRSPTSSYACMHIDVAHVQVLAGTHVCMQGMMYLVKGSTRSWSISGIIRSALTMYQIRDIACMAWTLT